jgi:two-component system response regulator YesN
MVRLMIVDDEALIRKGIISSIDWKAYDVEIVGEAENGEDALELAKRVKPHIVLTDIRMPVMDGLEFAKALKEIYAQTRIVALSGYDDFDYAKEAIRLQLSEYLLKPVGAEELVKLVTRLKSEIEQEREKGDIEKQRRSLLVESLPLMRSKFIYSIMHDDAQDKDVLVRKAKDLGLQLNGPCYQLFQIVINDYGRMTEELSLYSKELIHFALINVSEEILQSHAEGFVCMGDSDSFIGLVNMNEPTLMRVETLAMEISTALQRYVKLSVTIGISEVIDSMLDIGKAIKQTASALKQKAYTGGVAILTYAPAERGTHTYFPSNEEEKRLLEQLQALDREGINRTLKGLFEAFERNGSRHHTVKNFCLKIAILSINIVEKLGIPLDEEGRAFDPQGEIERHRTEAELESWFNDLLLSFIDLIEHHKNHKYKTMIVAVIQYINEHFDDELSLEKLANVVYVTSGYLSRIFKEETGVSLVDWIHNVRVDRAKDLLKNPKWKTYEIAEKVGYNDYKYFSHIFRKTTGLSPRDYRNRYS